VVAVRWYLRFNLPFRGALGAARWRGRAAGTAKRPSVSRSRAARRRQHRAKTGRARRAVLDSWTPRRILGGDARSCRGDSRRIAPALPPTQQALRRPRTAVSTATVVARDIPDRGHRGTAERERTVQAALHLLRSFRLRFGALFTRRGLSVRPSSWLAFARGHEKAIKK